MQQKQTVENIDIIPDAQQPNLQPESNNSLQNQQIEQDDGEQFFFPKSTKEWDFRPQWLKNTTQLLEKFDKTYEIVKSQKKLLDLGLKEFQQKRTLYIKKSKQLPAFNKQQYFKSLKLIKNHKIIELLHPSLFLIIYSYIEQDIYFAALKYRRISKSFNHLIESDYVTQYCMATYLGDLYTEKVQQKQIAKQLKKHSMDYFFFKDAILYYKSIQYSKLIPINSFQYDITDALKFINKIHQIIIKEQNVDIQYFRLMNMFLLKNQALMALSILSTIDIPILRSNAITALINHLAFNPNLRKQPIAKVNYNKILKQLDNEYERIPLIFNVKVSEYLLANEYQFSLIAHKQQQVKIGYTYPFCTVLIISLLNVSSTFRIQKCIIENHEQYLYICEDQIQIHFFKNQECCRYKNGSIIYSLNRYVFDTYQKKSFSKRFIYRNEQYMIIPIFYDELQN